MKGSAVFSKALQALKPYGLTKRNTVYAQSLCSDEINGDPGHLPTLLRRYHGRAFALGGIGGVPFVGKTGFAAFMDHVPKGGHAFVVFGPHIGFTADGQPGKFLRKGQAFVTNACGALTDAQAQNEKGVYIRGDACDLQQTWLRAKMERHAKEVAKSDDPAVDLVMKAFLVVEEEILAISSTDFGPGNLVLLGGIQINMPYPMPGFFLPLHFSVRSSTMEERDLMSTFS